MSSFSPKGLLAEREHLVMLAINRLGDRAYPVAIRKEISDRTNISLRRGAVYEVLERLERRGFLTSSDGPASPARDERVTKVFEVTREGHDAMAESTRVFSAWRTPAQRRTS